LYSC